ncbi:TetR family transcriptional regulator [Desemzia sp. RIT804]|uniref:TetR/AcrR family transcriptional regulator n=1 Tax=Desemzia sp. RIT 804 TaxID=2810209 RepID=UPI001950FF29|nr:TetR/AcrR family transcriptional regulator [Desemzia sp. RIT 804]MBM6614435.1 TetR family transcriptional regulator [Desemzia sp. RIT 804]
MPTKTFFNLSDAKRERLIDVATKEFSEKSLNEASINAIIKSASISRGSFYQYFENKEDLYFYIVKTIKSDSEELFKQELKKADGDIFVGFRNYFPHLLINMMEEPNANFYKQLFLHMDYRATKEVAPEELSSHEEGSIETKKSVFSFVNRTQLQVDSVQELNKLMRLITSIMMHEIIEGFARDYSQEKIKANFYQKLNWLEFGAKK